MTLLNRFLFSISLLITSVYSVDRSNFKTCKQATFCNRQRSFNQNNSPSTYFINEDTVSIQESGGKFSASIVNSKHKDINFIISLQNYEKEAIRLIIDEKSSLGFKRFDNKGTYVEESLKSRSFSNVRNDDLGISFSLDNKHRVKITYKPLLITFYDNDKEYLNINSKNLLNIEHFRHKPENAGGSNR